MKRSKMLSIIKTGIRANQTTVRDWSDGNLSYGKMSEILSERMLELIEGEGMLPPFSSEAARHSNQLDAAGYEWENEYEDDGE